ncbi:MAG: type II toxin-antitoxin system mRNA interferase toxin, RelE/StbE family [Parcubacteria group bacterium]|nr:type II toxin-antitoxin system mRNA interferase toxin, RelE/StbE family [Parcubacteria group bacterium]
MKIIFHKNFIKQYKKLSHTIQSAVQKKNILFEKDLYHPILNNHILHGAYSGYRSVNVTGNIRIIYKMLDKNAVLFVHIGTHSKLYS